jgi:hypothetical protein
MGLAMPIIMPRQRVAGEGLLLVLVRPVPAFFLATSRGYNVSMAKPFQFRLRTLLLVVVPVAVIALAVGWHLRQPEPLGSIPVSGSVTLDGAPLDGAMITFAVADRRGREAIGKTDTVGRFELRTPIPGLPAAKGVLPGAYMVTAEKFVTGFRNTTPIMVLIIADAGPQNFSFNLTMP